jgi:lysophospholipase L1-like esterase
MQQNYTYLALGDSYTIGEALALHESFPYQAVHLLRKKDLMFSAPEVIAKTGWTTDELDKALHEVRLLNKYDFVSLLIGVNNQYRGREAMEYKLEFESLLKKAIAFANDKPSHVVVLSIPDYGATPFAAEMDKDKITREIDIYNNINKLISIQYKTHYIDITPGSRKALTNEALVAADKLHPSSKEYKKWAEKLADLLAGLVK